MQNTYFTLETLVFRHKKTLLSYHRLHRIVDSCFYVPSHYQTLIDLFSFIAVLILYSSLAALDRQDICSGQPRPCSWCKPPCIRIWNENGDGKRKIVCNKYCHSHKQMKFEKHPKSTRECKCPPKEWNKEKRFNRHWLFFDKLNRTRNGFVSIVPIAGSNNLMLKR